MAYGASHTVARHDQLERRERDGGGGGRGGGRGMGEEEGEEEGEGWGWGWGRRRMGSVSHQKRILYHVLFILCPLLKDLQGEPRVQHAWSGEHNHGARVVDVGTIKRLKVAEERERGARYEQSEGRGPLGTAP